MITIKVLHAKANTKYKFVRFDLEMYYAGVPLMTLWGMRLKGDETLVPAQRQMPSGGRMWDHWTIVDKDLVKLITEAVKRTPEWSFLGTLPKPPAKDRFLVLSDTN